MFSILVSNAKVYVLFFRFSESSDLTSELYLANISLYVDYMESDRFITGNILFSSGTSLWTTDGLSMWLIVGGRRGTAYAEGVGVDAAFNRCICGFHQLNETHVILADIFNHCYRLLDRTSNKTSPYAGTCTQSGNQDGTSALFQLPSPNIHRDAKESIKLLFTDQNLHGPLSFKQLDMPTRNTTTMYTAPSQFTGLALIFTQDTVTGDIYFDPTPESSPLSDTCSLSQYNYETMMITCISKKPHGFIRQLRLIQDRTQLILLDGGKPTVFNLVNNDTSYFCGENETESFVCSKGRRFTSFLVANSSLYLGANGEIIKVSGKKV